LGFSDEVHCDESHFFISGSAGGDASPHPPGFATVYKYDDSILRISICTTYGCTIENVILFPKHIRKLNWQNVE